MYTVFLSKTLTKAFKGCLIPILRCDHAVTAKIF